MTDKNIFMMCTSLNQNALTSLSKNYHVRLCKEEELDIWKAFPFDTSELAYEYKSFMDQYFNDVYKSKKELFFNKCIFVCNEFDIPIATCFIWKAYGIYNTIHWFKVLKEYENLGIGRALLSIIMKDLDDNEYPVYLHTQQTSYKAIKLYSDFGFSILTNPTIGQRKNEIEDCLEELKRDMPENAFKSLKFEKAPDEFIKTLSSKIVAEF